MDSFGGQLRLYSSVIETYIDWLWYPYIPFGKITLLQGDPGCGKSTLMMNIISAISTGTPTPDGIRIPHPMHSIYQCCEDGISDTIKPRLMAAGADCSSIAFLDEEINPIALDDEQLHKAISEFNAKLVVIDPIQAYLGNADLASATGMRKMLRQLSQWATEYRCAIVLIGHLNKKQGIKDIYRSLGSIDLAAAARSILHLETSEDDPDVIVLRHVKCSIAPRGPDQFYYISEDHRIHWLERQADMGNQKSPIFKINKQQQAAEMLRLILASGPRRVSEVQASFGIKDISSATLFLAKKNLGIRSVKRDGTWYWELPDSLPRKE